MMGDAARERAKAFYRVAGFFPLTVCAIQLIMDNVTINIWVAVALLLIILVDFVESVRSFSSKTTACLPGRGGGDRRYAPHRCFPRRVARRIAVPFGAAGKSSALSNSSGLCGVCLPLEADELQKGNRM